MAGGFYFAQMKGVRMADTVVDYASGPPSAAAIKAAGHIGAVRYLSPPRPGTESWMTGKPVHRAELDDFDAHGLKMAMVWQFGKDADADVKRGYDGGVEDAQSAQAQLDAIQASGHPVIFAIDYDIELHEWNSYGVEYFRGAASVLGRQRVGVYGHSKVCHWAGPEDNVVAQVAPGRWFCWVTKAWSDGATGSDYAVLYQRIVDTAANPGPAIDGVTVDVNDVLFPEWGWRAFDEYKDPAVDVSNLPRVDKTRWMNKHYNQGRGGQKITHITRHHMAGIGDVDTCWNWWQTRAASAHYAVQDDHVGQLVRDEDTAWANGDAASNRRSIAIEHSNSAGASADWPISDTTIRRGAELAAELCLKHGLGRPEYGVNIDDHRSYYATSCPHHLAAGGKYHQPWMNAAQAHYDRLIAAPPLPATTTLEEGFLMALSDDEQRELLDKTRRVHHELTHNFGSRYPDSTFADTIAGYLLEIDRKVEDIHAGMLPWIAGRLDKIKTFFTKGQK